MDIAGIHVADLPEGTQPLELAVSFKALNAAGDICLYERISDGVTAWEAIGMLTTLTDTLRQRLTDARTDR